LPEWTPTTCHGEGKWELDLGAIALLWSGGCIIRSAFVGDIKKAYERSPALEPQRQPSLGILVRGESVHQLERVIHAGPIRVDRASRRDEKVKISCALTLLTNVVIAYNLEIESASRAA
jgi:hypothetical protein